MASLSSCSHPREIRRPPTRTDWDFAAARLSFLSRSSSSTPAIYTGGMYGAGVKRVASLGSAMDTPVHRHRTQRLGQLPIYEQRGWLSSKGEMRPANIAPEAAIGV